MIERTTEVYLKVLREERERDATHRRRLREARDAQEARAAQATRFAQASGGAADRPAPFGVVRHLARIVRARLDRPLRP